MISLEMRFPKQESIPVGCVLLAFVIPWSMVLRGMILGGWYQGYDPGGLHSQGGFRKALPPPPPLTNKHV